ncbi:transglycosylase SLT domain-containing protein [Bdellovibrio sp. HCB209]|uniref:transglycosylase SLT domain-containing protein n=1 Tax=Bdellovibrio sp. HCB209 TaxID=3394354 RepID=UPI0039B609FF
MKWTATLLKFSLIATCGATTLASSNIPLFDMIEMASSTPKAKSQQYTEKIYPLEIVNKTTTKSSKETAKKAPVKAVKAAQKTKANPKAKSKSTLPVQKATVSKEAEESISASAVQKVDQMNKVNDLLAFSKGDTSGSVTCKNCSVASEFAAMKFNECSPKNNYMEESLERKKTSNSYIGALIRTPINKKPMIRPVCIETAMYLQSAASGPVVNYKTCSGGNAKNAPARPCVSENYFTLINNSFEVVSQCMKTYIGEGESAAAQKQNILAVFGMITVESGFHVNIMSKTGAGGIGQFTQPAINAVNKMISETEEFLLTHPDARCQKLATEFLKEDKRMGSKNTCDRISITEGNPVTNMIYTYAALKEANDYFDNNIFNDEKMKAKFALSSNELAKIKRATMIWSHNTGYAGLKTPLTKLLTTKYAKKKVTNADTFLAELKEYARSYPNKGNAGSKARIKETANYYAKIQTKIDLVQEGAAGGSCLN